MKTWIVNNLWTLVPLWYVISIAASSMEVPKADAPWWKKTLYPVAHIVAGSWARLAPMVLPRFPQLTWFFTLVGGASAVTQPMQARRP